MALGPSALHVAEQRGARLLTLQDNSFPIVHFTVAVRHGALTDPDDARGAMATLLPLLLRGTQTRPRSEFGAALEALGSSIDAAVGHEMATLSGACLKAHFGATMALLAEAMARPALKASALASLVEETQQTLISDRDDDDTVADLFLRKAYYGPHRLASPASGEVHALGQLTRASVQRAAKHLAASRLVIGVAGDVTPAEAAQALAPLCEALDRAPPAAPEVPAPAPPSKGRILLVDKPDRTQVQLRLARPGVHVSHPDSYAFWLGIMAFGGTFTSPLTREVRDVRGWSYFAHADFRRRSRFVSPVVLRSAPALADAVDCLALKVELFDRLAAGQLEERHLTLARAYLLGRLPLQTATIFDLLGPAVTLDVLGLPQADLWDVAPRLEALTLGDIGATVGRHLSAAPATAVAVGPKEALLAPLQRRFPDYAIEVRPYTEGVGEA